MTAGESSLVLRSDVIHDIAGIRIRQRGLDGYLDATAMCKAHGKLFAHYRSNQNTTEFLEELSFTIGIPIDGLVQSIEGRGGGTWVHPRVAIKLAEWCSPQFAVLVNGWVYGYLSGEAVDMATDSFMVRQFIRELGPYHERGIRDGIKEGMSAVIPLVREAENKADTAIGLATQAFEVNTDTANRVARLEGKKDRRSRLSEPDKKKLRLTNALRYDGLCAMKGERCIGRIVDLNGNMLFDESGKPKGEYDHFYDVGRKDIRQSWLICRVGCHAELTAQGEDGPRYRNEVEFHAYQKQVEIIMKQLEAPLFAHIHIGPDRSR